MFERCRPMGRLFYLLLILTSWSHGQTPQMTTVSEGLFGTRSGAEKKDAALSFVGAALQLTDAVTNRQIVDEVKFKDGLSKIIDGTVECLNASMWAKRPGGA